MLLTRAPFLGVARAEPRGDEDALLKRAWNGCERRPELAGVAYPVHTSEHLLGIADHWHDTPGNGNTAQLACMASGYLLDAVHGNKQNDPVSIAALLETMMASGRFRDLESIDGPYLLAGTRPDRSEVIVIRDKLGLRPLYYALHENRLWFADDIRLLLHLRRFAARPLGLIEWLHYGTPLDPLTCLDGIGAVPAGHVLIFNWQEASLRVEQYFDPAGCVSVETAREMAAEDVRSLERTLEQALDNAIARATQGVKRVSVLVSGGVDSGLVAALASRHADITAVTVDVHGEGVESELPYARTVATALNLRHCVCTFGRKEFRNSVCDTVYALGTPIIVENAVALLHAARTRHLPPGQLILDGEGADALFCSGVNAFRYSMFCMLLGKLLPLPQRWMQAGLEGIRRKLAHFGLQTTTVLDPPGLDKQLGARYMEIQKRTADLLAAFSHVPDRAQQEISTLALREFNDYVGLLTLRLDRMAQAARSHVILPFLDREVFRFAQNVSIRHKIRLNWRLQPVTKWLLKRLTARHIPPRVVYRPKTGFHIPGGNWIGDMPASWRNDSWIASQFGLGQQTLDWWLAQTATRDRLFLITMEIWGRLFVERVPIAQVSSEWQSQS